MRLTKVEKIRRIETFDRIFPEIVEHYKSTTDCIRTSDNSSFCRVYTCSDTCPFASLLIGIHCAEVAKKLGSRKTVILLRKYKDFIREYTGTVKQKAKAESIWKKIWKEHKLEVK